MLELLSPAGSYEAFEAALSAGADAVYAGGAKFGARAYAENFSQEEILRAIDKCHIYGKKLYLTVNTLCRDREMEELYHFLNPLYQAGLHGIIIQDLGILRYVRECFPNLPIHASTQMTLTGAEGARFLKSLGAKRIVTSRELSLAEIRHIHENAEIEIESFIHGAMCYSYSGQCLFSSILGGRSGNRGRCAQPCRLPYEVYKDGARLNGKKEEYALSMRDLCGLSMIPDMAEAGILSFKIEGRMKKAEYSAGVTAIYRKYIDLYEADGRACFQVKYEDIAKLQTLYTRGGSDTGYLKTRNGRNMITLEKPGYQSNTDGEHSVVLSKVPVSGTCILKKNAPTVLSIACDGTEVCAETEPAQEARNCPILEEDVKKQLLKTGATDFYFENLEVVLEENCFLPVKTLNHLRSQGLKQLEEEICKPYRRVEGQADYAFQLPEPVSAREREEIFCMVFSITEAEALCDEAIDGIYLESFGLYKDSEKKLARLHDKLSSENKKLYLALPYIFRNDVKREYPLSCFDGILVRNYEELQWLTESGYRGMIRTDFNLYAFNREAEHVLRESGHTGIEADTAPLELNGREMAERGISRSELMVYGRIPMMISAQCLNKTFSQCRGRHQAVEFLHLKDRYRKEFPVLTDCFHCVNIVYNSVPLSLHAKYDKVKRLQPFGIRLVFTDEDLTCRKEIIHAYGACVNGGKISEFPVQNTTAGHFGRGVE